MLRERAEWDFLEYFLLMIPYLMLAFIAYILTPNFADDERDIKRYYFDNSRWIFSLAAAYLGAWIVFSYVVLGHLTDEPGSLARFVGLILMIALAVWKNERFHAAAVLLAYILLLVWLGATFAAA